ncbi:tetratricopeptide repeat protein [Planktothrix sp. FACHB-1365]|uniref:tetratricopeptide repeat protein n=1 Tax=Planktothrix sp. FACHB-1365 TaxID=2692855 RepID=UPI0016858608|nr:tetratricopeptide repeat protein [Planktothrix sp. FACHB-1365]MBD2481227.1 tetratricopeptide repeat protein [Planktothrix sp. FACHB-1365]
MRKSKLLPLVLIFSVLSYTPVGLGQSVEELFRQGNTAQDAGNYSQAETIFRQVIRINPQDVIAYKDLGNALYKQGKLEEAITYYQKAIQLDPKYAPAYNNLGNVLSGQGKLEEAIINYQKAIQLDPKFAPAYNNLGLALSGQEKLEEAIINYQKAIQLDPKYAPAYNNLGLALSGQGKLEAAITYYQKAIQLDPKSPFACHNLGNVLYKQGKLEAAITYYQKAIQLDPKFAPAYVGLGVALSDQGKREEAITYYQKAIQLDPKSAAAYYNLGNALHLQGKLEAAITNYRIALSLPDQKGSPASVHTLAHNNLGYALQKQGKLPEAIAEFQKSIALDRNFVSAQNNLKEAQRLVAQRSPQYVPPPASDLAFVPTLQQEPLRDELRATVLIIANDIPGTQGPTRGTGWVVKREGNTIWVVTNRHVIANQQRQPSPKIEIEFFSEIEGEKRRFSATVEQISNDPNLDLAVLKITGIPDDIRPLKMGTGRVSRNTKIIVIGHPINADPWNSSGGEVTNYSINKVTISAVVATGNSGGPVINETTKEVIGIMVRVADEDIATDPNTATAPPPDEIFTTGGFGIAYPIDLVQQQLVKWGINP